MSLLAEKLAGVVFTCRGCGCGCDDNHACIDGRGRPCSWALLDIETPTGVCSTCAERNHWHPFALAAMGAATEQEAAQAVYLFARLAPDLCEREGGLLELLADEAA